MGAALGPIQGEALVLLLRAIDGLGLYAPVAIIHNPTPIAALCPACAGLRRVPKSVTGGGGWRDCHFCLAYVGGVLMSSGLVHVRRLQGVGDGNL